MQPEKVSEIDVLELIDNSDNSLVEFSDGTSVYADVSELYRVSDVLAFHYGIGASRSFTHFVEMVNNEDPTIIAGLLAAANIRMRKMYSTEEDKPRQNKNRPNIHNKVTDNIKEDSEVLKVNGFNNMKAFLREWGATKEEILEAEQKIKSGAIKVPIRDYNWITSKAIESEGFPLKDVLRQMDEDQKNSINIKISLEKRLAKDAKNAR